MRQLRVHPRKVENGSDRPNRVIVRNGFIKTKRIEKLTLVVIEPPHHRSPLQRIASEQQNHRSPGSQTTFATKSANQRHRGRHSITSSARSSSCGGTSRPRAFAVLRLTTSSNLTGAWTGSSLGFSPLRMRSAYVAARRKLSVQ